MSKKDVQIAKRNFINEETIFLNPLLYAVNDKYEVSNACIETHLIKFYCFSRFVYGEISLCPACVFAIFYLYILFIHSLFHFIINNLDLDL